MARIRTVKPEFWTSVQVVECSPMARLLFIGMWNFCDDAGIHPASARRLKMEIFPGDDITEMEVESLVAELKSNGLVKSYSAGGKEFWQVTGWHHQKVDRPNFKHPQPKFDEHSTSDRRAFDEQSPPDVEGSLKESSLRDVVEETPRQKELRKAFRQKLPFLQTKYPNVDYEGEIEKCVSFYNGKNFGVDAGLAVLKWFEKAKPREDKVASPDVSPDHEAAIRAKIAEYYQ